MRSDFDRIDFHTHLFYDRPFLPGLMEEWGMRVGIINITGKKIFDESMDRRWKAMLAMKERYPERVFLCTSFDPEPIEEPGFADGVIAALERDLDAGAVMVKVWKDIGLDVRDRSGRYVMIDDEGFRPIWDFLAKRGIPVLAHIAEPRAAWLPLDRKSPHYAYYSTHPQYHLHTMPDTPAWEELIDARDRWVERNPGLTIIGAHFGSTEHDVTAVAERLDRYPNYYVDTAERFGDLIIQDGAAVRSFFLGYHERILYATDVIWDRPAAGLTDDELAAERASYQELLETHWNYLSGSGP
ncbi:MAG TPA: amidohydrolase family protein, partial [Rhodothermales bacterium]